MVSKSRLVGIVDDEQDIIKLFHDALGVINGITIFTFTDPIMALEHFTINKEKYVLVISDLRMPGINGMELIKKIKNVNLFVRTILMTAFEIDDKLFQEYTKKGLINGLLQKPIRLVNLQEEVNNQLHTYEFQKQNSLIKI
ncbi:MAG TPA: response regulator [Nitrososphaeraceae archaeon]|nr:response regulator [Nitrososphaeraceae archaeon]